MPDFESCSLPLGKNLRERVGKETWIVRRRGPDARETPDILPISIDAEEMTQFQEVAISPYYSFQVVTSPGLQHVFAIAGQRQQKIHVQSGERLFRTDRRPATQDHDRDTSQRGSQALV
jgi:hypothetical protein